MEISVESADIATVLSVSGNLDTATAPDAQLVLEQAITDGAETLVMDFAALGYISSAGLRVLLVAAKKLQRTGGQVRVCNLNDMVRDVFSISGFDSILPVFATRADALAG